jgi:hypothetical protein
MSTTDSDFSECLARVQANKGRSVIVVGQDELFVLEAKRSNMVSRKREVAGNMLYPASLVAAFVIGMIAVAIGNYARFHLAGAQSPLPDADLEMALTGFVGLCVSFALSQMFRITSKSHKAMQGAGVFLMVCTFHNLAFWAPKPMAALFSPLYVLQTAFAAEPNSFLFRGVYIPIGETQLGLAQVADACLAAPAEVALLDLTRERQESATEVAPPSQDASPSGCP